MVLGKLDSHVQKNETRPLSCTTRKDKLKMEERSKRETGIHQNPRGGIPGWHSGLAPAFGPGHDPGDPGSNPTSGSRCMEPASPCACVSAPLSLCDYHK